MGRDTLAVALGGSKSVVIIVRTEGKANLPIGPLKIQPVLQLLARQRSPVVPKITAIIGQNCAAKRSPANPDPVGRQVNILDRVVVVDARQATRENQLPCTTQTGCQIDIQGVSDKRRDILALIEVAVMPAQAPTIQELIVELLEKAVKQQKK